MEDQQLIEIRPDVGPIRKDDPLYTKYKQSDIKNSYIIILVILSILLIALTKIEIALLAISMLYVGMVMSGISRKEECRNEKRTQWINLIFITIFASAFLSQFAIGYEIYFVMLLGVLFVLSMYIFRTSF